MSKRRLHRLAGACACIAFLCSWQPVMAQTTDAGNTAPGTFTRTVAPFKRPHVNVMTKMIQSHMAAFANAIVTNNFSVLRDLGTPRFKNANTPERLRNIFGAFRKRGLNLTTVVLFQPVLRQSPVVDQSGFLRLQGHYKTNPKRVHFNLVFLPVAGIWRMDSISVHVSPTPNLTSQKPKTVIQRTILSRLNMRAKPSLRGKILAILQAGQKIRVLGQNSDKSWHKVAAAPGIIGYIKSSVLLANSK